MSPVAVKYFCSLVGEALDATGMHRGKVDPVPLGGLWMADNGTEEEVLVELGQEGGPTEEIPRECKLTRRATGKGC